MSCFCVYFQPSVISICKSVLVEATGFTQLTLGECEARCCVWSESALCSLDPAV